MSAQRAREPVRGRLVFTWANSSFAEDLVREPPGSDVTDAGRPLCLSASGMSQRRRAAPSAETPSSARNSRRYLMSVTGASGFSARARRRTNRATAWASPFLSHSVACGRRHSEVHSSISRSDGGVRGHSGTGASARRCSSRVHARSLGRSRRRASGSGAGGKAVVSYQMDLEVSGYWPTSERPFPRFPGEGAGEDGPHPGGGGPCVSPFVR